ncbi:short-chain dehydrogenase/reductase SDR [Rhodopirellula maiorica SM1]|uniref:Short-chain dehydrogenase/reductase SDR n=1 Tax=Rhodopirellula maiorica SM1 TaxID=1265738 RepID=M5R9N9_9BACT|nr:SDR family oxidoreductase [Rhodopirellula maiorica]EMI16095.1 short-chain dehydrogenase/reductase SDR [Rhodopirellula maiorica SM1]
MSFDIKNKTALVTGANRGIGRAIVEEALSRGAKKVYAAVRTLESADSLVREFGDRVVPVQFDLQDQSTIETAAKTASDVDLVVNNAGVLKTSGPISDDSIDSLQFEIDVNVYGLMRTAKAFAPVLAANGGGGLVQLNSIVSVKTFANVATYSASKAASYSITQALRDTLAEQGTQVISVHPGPIATDMADHAGFTDGAAPPSTVARDIFDALLEGRFHAWPDPMAQQIGEAYQSFAKSVVDADMQEESPA